MKIEKENILKAWEDNPEARKTLEDLFPEVFEDTKYFCKLGALLKRHSYPTNVYAAIKLDGVVRILNVSHSAFWDLSDKPLAVSSLRCPKYKRLTIGEFKQLVSASRFKDFYPVSI